MDGTRELHALIAGRIPRGARLLEVGAGAANPTSLFLATLGSVTGVDPDPAVLGNGALARAVVTPDERLPFPDGSFDAVVSNWVLEHLPDPRLHLREVARVLSPGGLAIARTPNRWHYVSVAARLTPHRVHVGVANRLRALGDDAPLPFPTFYRMNTRRALERGAHEVGLVVDELRMVEKEPSYGLAWAPLFLAGWAWERTVNATVRLASLRSTILVVLRKPEPPAPGAAAGEGEGGSHVAMRPPSTGMNAPVV